MSSRRQYFISYDISGDKRRNKVFQTLRDHGDHVQYSVFFCELNQRELARLRGRLDETIHARDDQVLILDLGPARNSLDSMIDCLGRAYEPETRAIVV